MKYQDHSGKEKLYNIYRGIYFFKKEVNFFTNRKDERRNISLVLFPTITYQLTSSDLMMYYMSRFGI